MEKVKYREGREGGRERREEDRKREKKPKGRKREGGKERMKLNEMRMCMRL